MAYLLLIKCFDSAVSATHVKWCLHLFILMKPTFPEWISVKGEVRWNVLSTGKAYPPKIHMLL